MAGGSKNEVIPNANDMRFIATAMANQTKASKLEIDWEAVAAELGLKNRACAQTRFHQISKKLGWSMSKGVKGGSPSVPQTPDTRARAVNAQTAGAASPGTPSKVAKATGRVGTKGKTAQLGVGQTKIKSEKQSEDDDDGDGDGDEDGEESEADVKEDHTQKYSKGNKDGSGGKGFDFSKAIV